MIDVLEKNLFEVPCNNGGITKGFNIKSHLGVDFGYYTNNDELYSIQEGTIVDNFYSDTCGYGVVIQHNYTDGTHRWSGYIHLRSKCVYAIGKTLKRGEFIGAYKGNTGKSHGKHLHIYVSNTTTKGYTWNTMKSLCNFDPQPNFYKSRSKTYVTGSATYDNMKWIEDYLIAYPIPVERNDQVKQVEVLIDYLYLRKTPNGERYSQYATKGIYNVLAEEISGNYCWYKIAENFWLASGGSRTRDLLPKLSKEQELTSKVNELQLENDKLNDELKEYKKKLDSQNEALKNILVAVNSAIL